MTRIVRTSCLDIETPVGAARLRIESVTRPRAVVVLGHGAGRGADTHDLLGLAASLPPHGVTVVLVDQPWVLLGRRIASPPATLDAAWLAVLTALRSDLLRTATGAQRSTPLVVGGRSAGARVACRTAALVGADAVLLLSYPLVPPSVRDDEAARAKALSLRRGELASPIRAGIPLVAAQGERDAFGGPDDLAEALGMRVLTRATTPRKHRRRSGPPRVDVIAVAGADHSLRVPRSASDPAPTLLAAALLAVARASGE